MQQVQNCRGFLLFTSDHFKLTRIQHSSLVLASCKKEANSCIWEKKRLLLFSLSLRHMRKKKITFSKYMECILTLNRIDQRLNCACLSCSTDYEIDYTLKQPDELVGNTLCLGNALVLNLYSRCKALCMSYGPAYHYHLSLRSQPGHIILSLSIFSRYHIESFDGTTFRFTLAKDVSQFLFQ